MNNEYSLFFREVYVGTVATGESDFPNMSGTFHTSAQTEGGSIRRQIDLYIEYCVAADSLMESGGDSEWTRFVEENESRFLDLIETDDWTLRQGNEVIPILVPVFYQNGQVGWRLNMFL